MRTPKILFFDIEASDLKADIGHIICIGYKWNFEDKAKIISLLSHPGKKINDDSAVLREFEKVFNQADLVVYHFGDFYDLPFIQTRRLIHGMKPLPNVASIDTWRICKKKLKFGSNRLDRVLDALKCPYHKTPLKLSHWAAAWTGDKKAIRYIIEHCVNDVLVLEWVYNKIRPVWKGHPRMFDLVDKSACPTCGSKQTESKGWQYCASKKYARRRCCQCGASWKGKEVNYE